MSTNPTTSLKSIAMPTRIGSPDGVSSQLPRSALRMWSMSMLDIVTAAGASVAAGTSVAAGASVAAGSASVVSSSLPQAAPSSATAASKAKTRRFMMGPSRGTNRC